MKILIFSQFFPPEMEPTGFMFNSFSIHLAKSKRVSHVEVICGFSNFPEGKFNDRKWYSFFRTRNKSGVKISNVFVIPSNNKSNLKRIINYTSYLITAFIKGIFSKKPDIIVASSPPIFAAIAALIVAKLKRAKFILDIRDIWPESAVQMGSISNVKIIKILEYFEKVLYKNADLITVATPGMINIVRSKIPEKEIKIEYIPCGVSIPDEQDVLAKGGNPFDEEDHNKFCVLYAGLHGHAQKLSTIIDAANILRDRSDIVFYFIGAGPNKDFVVDYANDLMLTNVRFLPPVSRDLIRRYYVFAGCGIVPLQDLNIFKNVFPSKTFELMSYGVPSIVGVGGEIAKVIDKSKAGISVSPEKAKSYVAAIERYSSDTNYRLEAKNNAYKTAKSDFDYDVINENFEDLLYEVFETK